jgi:hypothetical protein
VHAYIGIPAAPNPQGATSVRILRQEIQSDSVKLATMALACDLTRRAHQSVTKGT